MRSTLVVLLGLAACSPHTGPRTTCGFEAEAEPAIVLERGGETAALARIADGCFTEVSPDLVLGSDQDLFSAHGRPFVGVNDDGTLLAIDPDALAITSSIRVYPDHTEPTSIPHGIYGVDVDASGNLWVSRDDVPEVAVISPRGDLAGTVDLGALDPDEHHPDMNGILVQNGRAYVALGFLQHGPSGGIVSDVARRAGMIAVIDTASRSIAAHIDLVGHNPVRRIIPIDDAGKQVIVATPGHHDSIDASDGIDLVDLEAGTATQLVDEETLGGSVDEVVWAGPTEAYAIVLGAVPQINPTRVVAFDPTTVSATKRVTTLAEAPWFTNPTSAAYVHTGLAIDGDSVMVGDHTPGHPAVRVFSRTTHEELAPITATVEPPWSVLAIAR